MKQITIISGKGGTGKTTVASNFIKMANDHLAIDCDVDAANLHILLNPKKIKEEDFTGGAVATLTGECTNCGRCEEECRFEAISNSESEIIIDPLRCEGCGVCINVCPTDALELKSDKQGTSFVSQTAFCTLVHARLIPGAENSGLLITRIRNTAEDIANQKDIKLIIIDGAPGIGCPVISSLNGVDAALIVTEPTLSAISDFKKVYEVAKIFGLKVFVCINKYDLNLDNTREIEDFSKNNDIELIGKVPYDDQVSIYLSQKKFIVDSKESEAGEAISQMWKNIKGYLYSK
ncbi:MAG: 4Fe-4S dicluster domain-containing protein [Actinomycetota bacterium]|nr:MAG: 4Fe-4S dicluster domain-containing protein [Actinomycetota bacterium]